MAIEIKTKNVASANVLQLKAARAAEPRQAFPALITTPCQVWRCWTYLLPYYSVFAADTLLYAVTLTFDLWPWQLQRTLWCDETLYQIWTQSNNPRRSYCDFSVWPNDLEHALSVALGSRIIFTKFDFPKLIRAWIIAFFMLISYVTLWLWPLTRWPWKFVVRTSSVTWSKSARNLSEIEQSRLNYW